MAVDPNATWEAWAEALTDNEREAAVENAVTLLGWLHRGGFRPTAWESHPEAEASFIAWCDAHDIRGS